MLNLDLTQNVILSFEEILYSLSLAIIFASLLSFTISKTTRLLVDPKQFYPLFLILIPTTTLTITIIKSSIALSLGLVGALSIIRFRTPIKEPEELAYIFIAIAIGLGLGAGQYLITAIFFVMICLVMLALRLTHINVFSKEKSEYVFIDLVINKKQNQNFDLIQLIKLIKSDLDNFQIKSLEENKQNLELTLLIKNFDYEKIEKVRKNLLDKFENLEISIFDHKKLIT